MLATLDGAMSSLDVLPVGIWVSLTLTYGELLKNGSYSRTLLGFFQPRLKLLSFFKLELTISNDIFCLGAFSTVLIIEKGSLTIALFNLYTN